MSEASVLPGDVTRGVTGPPYLTVGTWDVRSEDGEGVTCELLWVEGPGRVARFRAGPWTLGTVRPLSRVRRVE